MISTYTLNNLGIVAGTCEELKIAEIIDTLIPPDPQQKVTTGQAIVAMIINGLGFSNRPLYLFPQFFDKKPVDVLLGCDITPDELNDDTIGRALDRTFSFGCTELFSYIASAAMAEADVSKKFSHLDTTTFSVHGEYDSSSCEDAAIHITHGHSKLKRPDLKQIFLNLLVSFDGGVPFFMEALDGNSSDSLVMKETVISFKKGLKANLKEVSYLVADSKFYSKDTIRSAKDDLLWISRVPNTLSEAKEITEDTARNINNLEMLDGEEYRYRKHRSNYGGVKQRWLVIHSEQAKKRTVKTVAKAVEKEYEKLRKQAKKLRSKGYYCEPDARKSLLPLSRKAKYHTVNITDIEREERYKGRGRPPKDGTKEKKINFYPVYLIERDEESIQLEIDKRSIFIVATNELSEEKLTDQEVFDNYKGQKHVERGFRFLKDPLFFASSLYLKKPERIVSLTMTMCLSLLVYSICERKLRKTLKDMDETVNNQVGKPTQKPTLRWVYQLFEDVHYVKIEEEENTRTIVKNVRADGEIALKMLGQKYMDKYLITDS
ncbi:MAG: IS1634 family transposase [Thermoplasmata archaeon]